MSVFHSLARANDTVRVQEVSQPNKVPIDRVAFIRRAHARLKQVEADAYGDDYERRKRAFLEAEELK